MASTSKPTDPEEIPGRGIVMSSRVRLARNLSRRPFPGWLKKTDRERVLAEIQPAVRALPEMTEKSVDQSMDNLSPLEKQVLVEQHLISREHAAKNTGSGILINGAHTVSIMINEEDHLRLQAILPGYELDVAWQTADAVDTGLERHLQFAFSPQLGYLTACPTNVGTGMRASVMLHLPGLVLSDQVNQVIKSVNQIGLAVRGLYGEGTEALGNLFQISNQMTLGESEADILKRLHKVIDQIIRNEWNARHKLVQDKGRMVADQLGRAFGIMQHACSMSSKEALNLLSLLILGVDLGVLPNTLKAKLDDLFIHTQPAHLQKEASRKLGAEERDAVRADLLREKLKGIPAPNIKKLKIV